LDAELKPWRPRGIRGMNKFYSNPLPIWAACGLLICFLPAHAKAQNYYWDINGATAGAGGLSPTGSWEGANWTTDSTGSSAPINLPENVFPRFAAGTDATGDYTVTASSDHTIAGMLHAGSGGTVTIDGAGILTIGGGVQQGFFGGSGGFIRIKNKLTGTGGVVSQSGQIYLDGDNDYSSGTTVGAGLINFNNTHSFGTGNILLTTSGSALIAEGTAAITIPNNWIVSLATVNLNCVGNTAGITYSGNVNLGANNLNIGSGGSTANIDIFSGVISGTGGFGRQSQTTAGIVKLTGANTYSGKTTLTSGTTWVSSLNSVVGGSASSSLGAPVSVASGTIGLGGGTTAATLVYTGGGETTDRVIDLAGTTGSGTIQNDGSGPLTFTSDFTATGAGLKTLTLRGTNTGNNTIAGKIVNSSSATSVAKSDAGTWTLSGANNYSGTTTLNAGRLNLGNASALGTGTFVIGGNGSFDNTSGGNLAIANGITLSGGSPTFVGTNSLTINGAALITTANRTITVTANTLTLGLGIGDSGQGRSFTKAGAGTLVLGAASTYTGTTTVSAGTLRFGAANAIASPNLVMDGGALNPGGFNQNLGSATFGLTASSTIDFGAGPVELDFANSSSLSWTGATLNLVNWDSSADKLRFGIDDTGLSSTQLSKIEFNGSGLGTAQLSAQGYVVVPEPSAAVLGFIGGLGMMCISRRRRV
jgi:autotransporter-associated beta strand protein